MAITNPNASMAQTTSTADYWANLVQTNLVKAKTLIDTDGSFTPTPGIELDEGLLNAPRRRSARATLACQVAALIYPPQADADPVSSVIAYEKSIKHLRNFIQQQRVAAKDAAQSAKRVWIQRILAQGPWDPVADPLALTGPAALPVPVVVSDKESFAPFFAHLRNGGTHESSSVGNAAGQAAFGTEPYYDVELIEFEKGVLYADGRVDLCNMVTGPRNIQDLMTALAGNTFSKHFLLGKNIIGPVGARAIAEHILSYPDQFETWYLAGNCIDAASFSVLVESMVRSEVVITNVWLKRNPLSSGSVANLFRLITESARLRTLDLDQTELGDAGVAELFTALAAHDRTVPLRHVYLNADGIGEDGCRAIAAYLASPHCSLESLYLSNNAIGDLGAAALATGVQANASLIRLTLSSCGLTNASPLLAALATHPNIALVDLGQSYATPDLATRYNWLTTTNLPSLLHLIKTTPKLRYLDISFTPIPQTDLTTLCEAVLASNLVVYNAAPLLTGQQDPASVRAGQEHAHVRGLVRERLQENVRKQYGGIEYEIFFAEHKRWLVSPRDVRLIDSVYRNRDAGMARRGEKVLVKRWGEGDRTLEMVGKGRLV